MEQHPATRTPQSQPTRPQSWRRSHGHGELARPLQEADHLPPEDKPRHFALSRTTDRVLQILLTGDLSRLRAESVAESLCMSSTTLRRRLRADHTCYQFLLDRARQYRCEQKLRQMWLPGKCLADELGYLEVNSFYRAFQRWTGMTYSQYKQRYC
jgi:AraC family mar-sox-rob regulon transcriptional activator